MKSKALLLATLLALNSVAAWADYRPANTTIFHKNVQVDGTTKLVGATTATGAITANGGVNATTGSIARAALTAQGFFDRIPLLTGCRNLAGTTLVAAAAAGTFGLTVPATFGAGTALGLIGESANNNTKTDVVIFEYTLPPEYVAGTQVQVGILSNITGAGTLGATKTLTVDAYDMTTDITTNLGPAAGVLATGTAAYQYFTLTSAGLSPGDKLYIQIQAAYQETAASAINCNINDIGIAFASIKG